MLHIQLPNPTDRDHGLAPIVPVLKKLMLDKYNTEHLIRFFKQGARLGGVIKTTKNLTKEQVSRLERTFESNYTGKSNFHRTLILPNGMDYSTIESSPSDSNIQEIQESNKEQILAAYGLPPIKVGLLDGASFANANVQNKTFYADTVIPLLRLIVEAINSNDTLVEGKTNLKFDFDTTGVEALQSDSVEKGDIARGMAATGLSINEIRKRVWQVGAIEGGHIIPAIHKMQVADAYSGSNGESNQVNGEDGVVGGQNRNDEPVDDPAPNPEDNEKRMKSVNDAANIQNDTEALSDVVDTTTTFEERVIELTQNAVGQGVEYPVAMRSSIQQALSEGLTPTSNEDGIQESKNAKNLLRYDPEFLVDYQKNLTGDGVDKLIEERKISYISLHENQMKRVFDVFSKSQKSNKSKELDVDAISNALVPTEAEQKSIAVTETYQIGIESTYESVQLGIMDETLDKFAYVLAGEKITKINETTHDQIVRLLENSLDNQVPINQIEIELQKLNSEFSSGRSKTISRTEVLSEVSFGQDLKRKSIEDSMPQFKDQMKKMWVTARDNKVRDIHTHMDGETVDSDEEFSNDLEYPRDRKGSAEQVINCRCTVIDFLDADKDEISSILDVDSATDSIIQLLEVFF